MNFLKKIVFFLFGIISMVSCSQQKINGASLVSPPRAVDENSYTDLKEINATWVAVIPFAFTALESPKVNYNKSRQWWGEKPEGAAKLIQYAKKQNLKVMLKPHVWIRGTWIGDFELHTEEDWLVWEQEYTNYIMHYANIAALYQVDLFCIGTELKKVVLKRPRFFLSLIKKIKKTYKGKLTYAANWDNMQQVSFWKELDYVGVDAYFPLSNQRQPTVKELNKAWQPIVQELKKLSEFVNKPVLFTEYGFESCDYNAKDTWGSYEKHPENQQAQANAYQSYFDSFYKEKWFAGGFFWKWHLTDRTMRNKTTSFTPQNKQALKVIRENF